MPIYEFTCLNPHCDEITEVLQKYEDVAPKCKTCGTATQRIVSMCGWNLEGEGWYNPHNPMRSHRGGVPKPAKKT